MICALSRSDENKDNNDGNSQPNLCCSWRKTKCRPKKILAVYNEPLDLYLLYHMVLSLGGFVAVTRSNLWQQITNDLKIHDSDGGSQLALYLEMYLYAFELANSGINYKQTLLY